MFLCADIFTGIRARNRLRGPIALLSKTIFAKCPLKKDIPFYHVISAIAIRLYVSLLYIAKLGLL
jgi:hypothetical protein